MIRSVTGAPLRVGDRAGELRHLIRQREHGAVDQRPGVTSNGTSMAFAPFTSADLNVHGDGPGNPGAGVTENPRRYVPA